MGRNQSRTAVRAAGNSEPAAMDSRSLRPLLAGRTKVHRSHLVSSLEGWRMVWDGRHKLIEGYEKEPQFFDLQTDPLENSNLSAQPSKIRSHLKTLLPG